MSQIHGKILLTWAWHSYTIWQKKDFYKFLGTYYSTPIESLTWFFSSSSANFSCEKKYIGPVGHVIIFFLQKDLFSLPAFVLFFLKNNRVFSSLLFLPFQAFWHQKRIQRHRATTRERGKDNQLIHRGKEKKKVYGKSRAAVSTCKRGEGACSKSNQPSHSARRRLWENVVRKEEELQKKSWGKVIFFPPKEDKKKGKESVFPNNPRRRRSYFLLPLFPRGLSSSLQFSPRQEES